MLLAFIITLIVLAVGSVLGFKGQCIVVSGWTDSKEFEGIMTPASVCYPGIHLEPSASLPLIDGHFQVQYFQTASQGRPGPVWILQEDRLQGGTMTTPYTGGKQAFIFQPQAGDQCNVLVAALSGTSPTVTVGEFFMIDSANGMLEINSGAYMVPWISKEAYVGAAGNTLTWCQRI